MRNVRSVIYSTCENILVVLCLKVDKEKKRQEDLARKTENKKLLAEEEDVIKGKPAKPAKLTRAQVVANQLAAQQGRIHLLQYTHQNVKVDSSRFSNGGNISQFLKY